MARSPLYWLSAAAGVSEQTPPSCPWKSFVGISNTFLELSVGQKGLGSISIVIP